jgi:hypothetical protein
MKLPPYSSERCESDGEFTKARENDFSLVHDHPQPRISIFLQSLQLGGAERTMLTLADGLSRNGCQVDLLLVVKRGDSSMKYRGRCG